MATLDGEHEGLVFGRLDFLDREKSYIGRLGVRTPDYEPLVIDWRAQAAEPFYRATPVHPMSVVRRRVLTSRDDRVTGIEDDILMPMDVPDEMTVIGDGALMKALDRARGPKMRDIVATIQAEQDEVIRAPHQGFTLITGGPGTGKTVVGLHRIAFLLYTYRRRFTNGGVLVIGPSPIFMDYIERVLPSLGEESVTLNSVGQIASDVLGFSSCLRDDAQAWQIKGGLAMVSLLRHLVEAPQTEPANLIVTAKGEPLTMQAAELASIRRECLNRLPYNEARHAAEKQILDVLWAKGEPLVDVEWAQFNDLIRDSWAFTTYMDRWWPPMDPSEALSRLRDARLVRSLSDLSEHQAQVLAASLNPEAWTIADIPLLDELAGLLGPVARAEDTEELFFPDGIDEVVTISEKLTDQRHLEEGTAHTTYAHILVDEAQDITPMQWRMIHRRGPNASWTIVGDPAQSSWPDKDEPARALESLIGSREQRSYRLSTNYRSPKEAYDLATAYIRSVEPDTDIPQAVRSTGIEPSLLVTPGSGLNDLLAQEISRLLDQVEGSVGIIADPRWCLTQSSDPRAVVLDPLSCKGLEFDAVIVVDPDGIVSSSPAGARILYVALTRATQILVTVDIDRAGSWRAGLAAAD